MQHVANFLDGIARSIMWGAEPRTYINPNGGFARDKANLQKDVRKVGSGMKKTLQRHGKQVTQSRG